MNAVVARIAATLILGLTSASCGSDEVTAATSGPEDVPDVAAVPATVVLDSPTPGALVAGPLVTVAGHLEGDLDSGAVVVLIDGQAVPVVGGKFEAVVARGDGPAEVEVILGTASSSSAQIAFEVDALPPRLSVTQPARATHLVDTDTVAVVATTSDERGIQGATVGSVATAPDDAGGIATQASVARGLSLLAVTAKDAAGLDTTETTAILAGSFSPASESIPDAAVVHVGPAAFDVIARAASKAVDALDLDAFTETKNPFVDSDSLRIDVTHAGLLQATEIGLGVSEDRFGVFAALNGLELSARATLKVTNTVFDIALTVQRLSVRLPLVIGTEDGRFTVSLETPTFEIEKSVVTVTAQDGTPVQDQGIIEGEVLATVEELIASLATEYGKAPIQNAADALTKPLPVPFLGAVVTIDLSAIGATADADGLELRLSGTAFAEGDPIVAFDPGAYRTPDGPTLELKTNDVAIALSDDLVNTALHEAWSRGWLRYTIDQSLLDGAKAEVDLVVGFLGGLVDILGSKADPESPLTVDLAAGLPPVLARDSQTGLLTLGLGDATLGFRTGDAALATGYLSLVLGLGAESEGEKVGLRVDVLRSAFDLAALDPEAKRRTETEIEPFVESLLTEIGPLLSTVLVPFQLPAFAGFQPVDLSVDDDGTDGAYLVIHTGLRRRAEIN